MRQFPRKFNNLPFLAASILGLTVLIASPRVARADADADAQDLFVRGRELRGKKDCGGAVALFRKANNLAPQRLGSLRNIAECEEELGHFASSRRAWLELGRGLLVTKDPGKYDGWSNDARDNAARLEPKVARLRVDLLVTRPEGEGPAQAGDGSTVTINGEVVPLALLGTVLEKDPGKYTVHAEAASGEAPVEQEVSLVPGDSKDIRLKIKIKPKPKEVVYVERTSARRIAGYVTLGVGGASLIAAGVSLIVRQGALGDLEAACPGYETGPCPTSTQSVLSRGSTAATMTTIFGIAGGVLAAGGLTLVLASPDEKVPVGQAAKLGPPPPPRVAISPTIGGAQLVWRFE